MQVRSGPPDRQPRGGGGVTQPEAPLDLLVIGSGVAGLSAAVRAADRGLVVGVLTKGHLEQSTTRWAQGGMEAVLGGDPDSTDLHLADTLAAGVEIERALVAAVRATAAVLLERWFATDVTLSRRILVPPGQASSS
ncbi:MAG TPA: FAD-dependent oxidoreductase [Acidimicrobiia bacterium]|nr:FAD-dependent oxidoreductase [Acidimicrobiia bacterium]